MSTPFLHDFLINAAITITLPANDKTRKLKNDLRNN